MGLMLPQETPFTKKIKAQYWSISTYQNYKKDKCGDITMHVYFDKEAKDAGCDPVAAWTYRLAGPNWVNGLQDADIYAIVKTLPFWQGAEDVLEEGQSAADPIQIGESVVAGIPIATLKNMILAKS